MYVFIKGGKPTKTKINEEIKQSKEERKKEKKESFITKAGLIIRI